MNLDSNFFLENLILGEAFLSQEESLHIVKSFRARVGDSLRLCNGKGNFAEAKIIDANSKACRVLIERISEQEKAPKIHLAISCLLNGGEEDVVFHAAQMPLAAIHLLRTEKSLEQRASNLGKLCKRMEAKSLVALKQSRKAWLTKINPPVYLNDFLENFKGNLIVCDKNGEAEINQSILAVNNIAILTGPEGGFSPAELDIMKNKNAFFLSLGTTRLRAVSAPIFALAKLSLNS